MDINPQKITLDINSDTCFQLLVVKQWDKGSRYIEITLTADGTKLELSKLSSSILFSASLNGVLVQNDTFNANEDTDTVTVKLSDNALSASGRLECEITAIKDNDKVTSATFYVKVAASAKGKAGAILDLLEGIVDSRMIQNDSVTSSKIAKGAVGSSQLADGAIDRIALFSQFFLETYLSMPMRSKTVAGSIQDDTYNSLTETGVYNVGSSAGEREMLVVYKLSSAHLVQVRYLTDKICFRGIHATKEGTFPADEWGEWEELTNKMPAADTLKHISSIGEDADPELIAYQTSDPSTPATIRIPLSVIKSFLGIGDCNIVMLSGFNTFDELAAVEYSEKNLYEFAVGGALNQLISSGRYIGKYSEAETDKVERILTLFNYTSGEGYKVNLTLGTVGLTSGENTVVESTDPNRHAVYFDISEEGELSLESDYAADGSKNTELPADLVIPEVVNEVAVDKLSSKMFLENKVIESVTLPDTIDEISDECFNMAVNLRCVKNTEHIKKLGVKAFRYTRLEKAVFPNLEELAEDESGVSLAFSTVPHLIYADVGKVTTIPAKSFKHCISLSKVVGDNITNVEYEAFCHTPKLTNAGFVPNLKSIGDLAFWHTKFKYDWKALSDCEFAENATTAQVFPEDFWSNMDFTPCENPTPTALCQCNPAWRDVQYGVDVNPIGNIQTYHHGCMQMAILHAYSGLTGQKFDSVFEFEEIVKGCTKADEKVVVVEADGSSAEFDNYLCAQNATFAHAIPMVEAVGLSTKYYDQDEWDAETLSALYETLKNGGYVVLDIDEPMGHAILIHGVNEKGELLVLDSGRYFPYDDTIPHRSKLPFNALVFPTSNMLTVMPSTIIPSFRSIDATTTPGKITFTYRCDCQEDIELVKIGIIVVNKENYKEATFFAGTTDTNVYDRCPQDGVGALNENYAWTKSNVAIGDTWVARAYVQYKTHFGSIVTKYSDLAEITRES